MKKIIGTTMLVLLVVGLLGTLAYASGLLNMLIAFGILFAFIAYVALAAWLIES